MSDGYTHYELRGPETGELAILVNSAGLLPTRSGGSCGNRDGPQVRGGAALVGIDQVDERGSCSGHHPR
ncbi:hypothetical protein ABTY96_44665 [Streptomyces sp. NPDC096057]|uniref:hypothetical protein n=1 Tax=Streptomyces sp. NPDC096057 TaxID=3155543 RepID=UPI0033246589